MAELDINDLLNGFQLGECHVTPLRNEVRAPNGETRYLPKKPMDVLVFLASKSPQIVEKDRILDEVWGRASGGDEGLKRCVHAIRKALQDNPREPKYIKTIPRRGYSCEASVCTSIVGEDSLHSQGEVNDKHNTFSKTAPNSRQTLAVIHCSVQWRDSKAEDNLPDPEVVSVLLPELYRVLKSVIDRFDGTPARSSLKPFQVWFGYRGRREDSVTRAIYCALALTRATDKFSTAALSSSVSVGLAIGVHYGDFVEDSRKVAEPISLIGPPLQIAEQLSSRSGWNKVVCSLEALGLSDGLFVHRQLPTLDVSSDAMTIQSAQVIGEVAGSDLWYRHSYSTPLIGRELEIATLRSRWDATAAGYGAHVIISGESGIGKTRLTTAMIEHIRQHPASRIVYCQCSSVFQFRPYHPLVDYLSSELGDGASQGKKSPKNGLWGVIEECSSSLGISKSLAAELLQELTDPQEARSPEFRNIAAKRRRQLTEQLLLAILQDIPKNTPTLLMVEDLHWADPSFSDLLGQMIGPGTRPYFMLVVTTRLERRPEWTYRSHVTQLALNELNPVESKELIECSQDGRQISEKQISEICDQAGGNPLFLEEFSTFFLSKETRSKNEHSQVQVTLKEALQSRLDELGKAREVALAVSVIGREFDFNLAKIAVPETCCEELVDYLNRLASAGVLFQMGLPPHSSYSFKHGLLQKEAYRCLTSINAKRIHSLLAHALEQNNQELQNRPTELIAHHLSNAGEYMSAASYWEQAADRAARQSGYLECASFARRGLIDAAKVSDCRDKDILEIGLLIRIGNATIATDGYSAPEVAETYRKARELCEKLPDSLAQAPALAGLWAHYLVSDHQLQNALLIAEKLFQLTENVDEDLLLEARVMLGVTLVHLAEYDRAIKMFDEAIQQFDANLHSEHCYVYGQDPAMAALIYKGVALAQMGDSATAIASLKEGVLRGEKSGHAHSYAFANAISARTLFALGHISKARINAERAKDISKEYGLSIWIDYVDFLLAAIKFSANDQTYELDNMVEILGKITTARNTIAVLDYSNMTLRALAKAGDWKRCWELNKRARAEMDSRGFCSDAKELLEVTRHLSLHAPLNQSQRREIDTWIEHWGGAFDKSEERLG